MIDAARRSPMFVLLLFPAWLLLSAQLLFEYWPAIGATLPDADDAMRLVEVREFLAGRRWFDLHEARLGFEDGYDTHWSRLIDAGLAGLYLLARPVADSALSERLMIAVWPVLWLLPIIGAAAAIAWRIAGREAALIVLLLAIFAGPGIQQFRPGRIDHHNVQIALSVVVVAATVWIDRARFAAAFAGALSGLMLTVGFEGLPLLAACGATIACHYVVKGQGDALRGYGLALAAGGFAALMVGTPPALWSVPVCDKIAINSALALSTIGLGVALVPTVLRLGNAAMRLAALVAVGVAAILVFAAIEPRCLAGHYALVDPAVRPIWLDHVSETKPLMELLWRAPASGLATLAFPIAALIAALLLLRQPSARSEFGSLTALAALAVSLAYMAAAMRGVSYAIWLGMPFIAACALHVFRRIKLENLAVRFAALLLVTPTALTLGALTLASAAGQRELTELNSSERAACTARAQYGALAALPPGRVAVNEIEWGPYLLAWTPHAVLAAPYHRLAPAILASHRVFASAPDQAREAAAAVSIDYIVICGSHGANGVTRSDRKASLWSRLRAGAVPGWLEPVAAESGQAFAVYRVKR